MLAGLAATALGEGPGRAIVAFGVAAVTFVSLLVTSSIIASFASADTIRNLRFSGPTVKRWAGSVLVGLGIWFVVLGALGRPPF